MAKRRIQAPTAADMAALDAAYRSETAPRVNPATAPIAQVAADSALSGAGQSAQDRFAHQDAQALRDAKRDGLLVQELPLGSVDVTKIMRDRSVVNQAELDELVRSIAANGQRLPIEVYQSGDSFALISGYRRLLAFQHLAASAPDKFAKIKAFVRAPKNAADAFAAMVEENEIRADLSHFERGRIAVIAAEQGAFENAEAAVAHLFVHASKAKRSKIRSFAELFECLGDLLAFPEDLTERRGLRLAGAIRQGAEQALRDALGNGAPQTADEEWALLDPVITTVEAAPKKIARPGRRKAKVIAGWTGKDTVRLKSGVSLTKGHDGQGYFVRFGGKGVDAELLEAALQHLQYAFDSPQ